MWHFVNLCTYPKCEITVGAFGTGVNARCANNLHGHSGAFRTASSRATRLNVVFPGTFSRAVPGSTGRSDKVVPGLASLDRCTTRNGSSCPHDSAERHSFRFDPSIRWRSTGKLWLRP